MWAIEPAGYDDHKTSLARGELTPLTGMPASTICDALQASAPGHLTFAVTGGPGGLAGAAALGDDEVKEAMAVAFDMLKLVLEPSGALGLAECAPAYSDGGSSQAMDLRNLAPEDQHASEFPCLNASMSA